MHRYLISLLFVLLCITAVVTGAARAADALRVCADPNNMPLSNERGEGYENKIAEALAHDLGRQIEYTWFPQRIGFVRHTLKLQDESTHEYKCDVIIGVPAGYELTATTQPYLHSTYALVYISRSDFDGMHVADDLLKLPPDKLKALRIGVFSRSPGADWLLRNNLLDHAAVYTHQSGDPAETPELVVERELAAGNIDLAIIWGPMAGLLVQQHAKSPAWNAVPFKPDTQIQFDYKISMGVRFGEKDWKATLDDWIAAHRDQIAAILASYRIPVVDESGNVSGGFTSAAQLSAGAVVRPVPLKVESQ